MLIFDISQKLSAEKYIQAYHHNKLKGVKLTSTYMPTEIECQKFKAFLNNDL